MRYSSLYKISKDNGLLAHVYEHLLAQYVLKYLQDRGFFISSDIILTAKTYGDAWVRLTARGERLVQRIWPEAQAIVY